jgi:hypothetical protein
MWKQVIRYSDPRCSAQGWTPGWFSARRVVGALSLAAIGGTFVAAGNSENLMRSSFEQAIRNSAEIRTAQNSTPAARLPISGSEEFWLTALSHNGIQPVSKSVTIGDRISMTLSGVERNLEVASVAEFDPKTTEIDTRARPVRLVLVTARDVNDSRARPIRFVMELETASDPAVSALPAKTL